jgi:segregation and condensation protein B
MEMNDYKAIVEGLLFAAGDDGLSLKQVASVLELEEEQALRIIEALKADLNAPGRGLQLIELAGVFQLATKREHAPYLKKLVESPGSSSLSQAALETLAIIAYKQPITRAEIEAIRGVGIDHSLATLMERSLVKEVGRKDGPGRPVLYGTTDEFLQYFGLPDLDHLPPFGDEEANPGLILRRNTLDALAERVPAAAGPGHGAAAGAGAEPAEADSAEEAS